MAKAKNKSLNFSIDPEDVVYTNISKSSDYNSARVSTKIGDKAYLSVSIEWADGEPVPDVVMDIMDTILKGGKSKAGVCEGKEEVYEDMKNVKKKFVKKDKKEDKKDKDKKEDKNKKEKKEKK